MKTNFTNFKLSMGIRDKQNDIEYSQIMLGVLRELYSTFGIALLRDIDTNSQSAVLVHDTPYTLVHKNIKSITVETYVEGTDYEVDYENGTIASLSSGSILNNATVTVDYEYYVFINESSELNLEIYPRANKTTYTIGITPYTLNSVTYDGNTLIRDADYYEYNNRFELPTANTELRKPYILQLNVGYDILPNDLKMAFYELISLRYERRKAKADLISRVQDKDGSETTYVRSIIPPHLKSIFHYYTGRNFASVR